MTAKEMAEYLNRREYHEINHRDSKINDTDDLVIIYGYPDEIITVAGAFNKKMDAWGDPVIYLNRDGIFDGCPYGDTKCKYCKEALQKYERIIAEVEDSDEVYLTFDTELEHETFELYDSNSLCCIGIVIDLCEI